MLNRYNRILLSQVRHAVRGNTPGAMPVYDENGRMAKLGTSYSEVSR
jgi:hypothetical protein